MMTNKLLAKQIVESLGGKDNITNALHCVTRLRFNLRSSEQADIERIEQLEGVLGVQVKNGQYQIIIGPMVADVFMEVEPLLQGSEAQQNTEKQKVSGKQILDVITGIFSSILPALVAGGMLKGIIALLDGFRWIATDSGTFTTLNMISDIPFYFLPFLLAISSSRKFKVNEYLGICVAGALMYPTFVAAVSADVNPFSFLGIEIPVFQYASSVFPVILGVGLLSIIYRFVDRFIPNVLKMVLVPTIALVVTIPLTLLLLAPLGAYGGIYLADGIVWMFNTFGLFAGFLLGFFMPLIVVCGMHQSTSPIQITNIATLGYDYLLPISFCHNMAESGASFGAALRMKDAKLRAAAMTTSFSAFLGISEPALFTVNLVYKKPLLAAMIANGIGGALTIILGAKCFAFVMPGITSLPVYANPDGTITNLLLMIICIASTFVLAAALSYIFGIGSKQDIIEPLKHDAILSQPIKGSILALSEVADDTFAKGFMGKGYAILPTDTHIYAPCDGTITVLSKTLHALGLTSSDGVEILIHVGIDTVQLQGKYFQVHVKQGDSVKKGDLLLDVDFDAIQKEGYDITIPIICTNSKDFTDVYTYDKQKKIKL